MTNVRNHLILYKEIKGEDRTQSTWLVLSVHCTMTQNDRKWHKTLFEYLSYNKWYINDVVKSKLGIEQWQDKQFVC